MSAIERCRTAALGGHVARCENAACGHTIIAYNSCRNRHCPKCQAAASRRWLADREAELLPVPYFHVVYTLPSKLRDIAYQNKRVVYDLLMKAAAETTLAIAADPRRLGAGGGHEFIRRLLLHVLPKGFHRIRHYGLFANANRAETIATARALLGADPPAADPQQQSDILPIAPRVLPCPCPRCGDRMIVIEVFARGCKPRWRPTPTTSDTS